MDWEGDDDDDSDDSDSGGDDDDDDEAPTRAARAAPVRGAAPLALAVDAARALGPLPAHRRAGGRPAVDGADAALSARVARALAALERARVVPAGAAARLPPRRGTTRCRCSRAGDARVPRERRAAARGARAVRPRRGRFNHCAPNVARWHAGDVGVWRTNRPVRRAELISYIGRSCSAAAAARRRAAMDFSVEDGGGGGGAGRAPPAGRSSASTCSASCSGTRCRAGGSPNRGVRREHGGAADGEGEGGGGGGGGGGGDGDSAPPPRLSGATTCSSTSSGRSRARSSDARAPPRGGRALWCPARAARGRVQRDGVPPRRARGARGRARGRGALARGARRGAPRGVRRGRARRAGARTTRCPRRRRAPSGAEQARLWELLREEAGALARDAPPPPAAAGRPRRRREKATLASIPRAIPVLRHPAPPPPRWRVVHRDSLARVIVYKNHGGSRQIARSVGAPRRARAAPPRVSSRDGALTSPARPRPRPPARSRACR